MPLRVLKCSLVGLDTDSSHPTGQVAVMFTYPKPASSVVGTSRPITAESVPSSLLQTQRLLRSMSTSIRAAESNGILA